MEKKDYRISETDTAVKEKGDGTLCGTGMIFREDRNRIQSGQ